MGATAILTLSGSYALQAPSFPPSAAQTIGSPISEISYVQAWDAQAPNLNTDGQISIPFPIGMTQCHVIMIKVQGGSPIDLYVTTADGSLQVIPVDSFAIHYFNSKPATALAVARTAGVPTQLTYLIAQNQ